MQIWRPVKFTIIATWQAHKRLFLIYILIQTILALTYIIDLFSYKEVVDSLNHSKTILGLSIYGVIIFLLFYYLSYKVLDGISNYLWNVLESHQLIFLNTKFISKLSTLDLSNFENPQNVGLANRAFNRFQMQTKYYLKAIIDTYSSLIKLAISLSIFFLVTPVISIVIVASNIIHVWINSKQEYGVFLIYRADDEIKRKFEYIVNTLFSKDTLPEIKLYGAFPFFKERFIRIYKQFTSHQLKIEKKHQAYNTLSGFLPTLSLFLYFMYIANQASAGLMSSGQFIFLFFNSLLFNGTLANLGQNVGHLHADSLFMQDALDFFALKQNVSFLTLSASTADKLRLKLENPSILLENVSFKYPEGKDFALKNINLQILFGENVALIGENGAGKTTIVKLLLRMYDPTNGKISINGINLKSIPEELLFSLYSTLFQSYGKFYFTVKENLEMAAGKDLSEEKMVKYLNFSNSWEFIKHTPGKLNQQLGSEFTKGIDLSGGQWQRLAIARAYAKKSPVLILDEPTSAVDAKSEMEIFDRLNKEMDNNSLIFISHRFSTIKDAKRIVVIDKGKIIEDGTHEKLMQGKGKYARLYTIQAERYLRGKT
ncbi:ABC transporter ATP-binding protein/permease [Patescibacteria group bacterium]|nr:ABC transporter ATP-binding protein/permease [Patescibacteria group bacterium]MCL5797892.1 ABC transporter ATP-binding protein/permease [Patescibacteria group bacterium]